MPETTFTLNLNTPAFEALRDLPALLMIELRREIAGRVQNIRRRLGRRTGALRRSLYVSKVGRGPGGQVIFTVGFRLERQRMAFAMKYPDGSTPAGIVRDSLVPELPTLARKAALTAIRRIQQRFPA